MSINYIYNNNNNNIIILAGEQPRLQPKLAVMDFGLWPVPK